MLRYQEIKTTLIEMIGRMDPGTRLPARPMLCQKLETTRTTLDRAIRELEDEGVLRSTKGSGTYVVGLIDGAAPHVENWCVIVPNVMDDIYPSLIRGIENVAQAQGANVVLCNSDNDPEKQERYIKRLLVSGVSGFIIVPVISDDVATSFQLYQSLLDSRIPFVFCNRSVDGIQAPVVKSNDFYGGYIATKFLIQQGYRKIAYIAKTKYRTSVDRCQGYMSALLEQGMEINRKRIILPPSGGEIQVYQAMKELLNKEARPDAVFCFNDYVALDVCRAITDSGKQISNDVGVIGYDNIGLAASASLPISSVSYKSVEIGEKAASVLSDMVRGLPANSDFEYYLFQPAIVERESCRGPIPSANQSM